VLNDQPINILVFPCGSEIGLEVHRSLQFSRFFHLVGASSVSDHGSFVFEDYVNGIPFVNDDACVPALSQIIQDRKIQILIPATDTALMVLKEAEHILGCKVLASCVETTALCYNKAKTYRSLNSTIAVPKLWNNPPENETDYPVFLKPEIGHSSIGTRKCYNAEECFAHMKMVPNCLILEYLPGEEYTIDCFSDRHGHLRFAQARTRSRIQNGISVHTRVLEEQDEFQYMAIAINQLWSLRGAWFFQLRRRTSGELVLLEVASRLAGSSGICRVQGINFAILSVIDALDLDVTMPKPIGTPILDRALSNRFHLGLNFNTVYCDFDDCLIIRNQVNIQLVSFLYHCHNTGKNVVLISRHKGNLDEELSKWRLQHLFHQIFHIDYDSPKADHIVSKSAIFIDDSFAERQAVYKAKGIPVFGPDAVEALF
jgi:hypothetical protein